jgi:hypothetical protein
MDSTAAIGALKKSPVSERKRIRAPGRPWLNFCREELTECIDIQHISSHKGEKTPEQRGNATADLIANDYRRQGELKSVPYFTAAEENYCMQHGDEVIQGDVRLFLKSLEQKEMLDVWKKKAKRQTQWISQFPIQIMKQAKVVWKWSIQRGVGAAWMYYIFAVCQWLPTNHRVHKEDKSGLDLEKCKLCTLDQVEDINHILSCPALLPEQKIFFESVEKKLLEWRVPYTDKHIESKRDRTFRLYVRTISKELSFSRYPYLEQKLHLLISDFCEANVLKQAPGPSRLTPILRSMLQMSSKCPLTQGVLYRVVM